MFGEVDFEIANETVSILDVLGPLNHDELRKQVKAGLPHKSDGTIRRVFQEMAHDLEILRIGNNQNRLFALPKQCVDGTVDIIREKMLADPKANHNHWAGPEFLKNEYR